MNKADKKQLYWRLHEQFVAWCNAEFAQHLPEPDASLVGFDQVSLIVGCNVNTLVKLYRFNMDGLKLSYEQVVSLAQVMKIKPETLFFEQKDPSRLWINTIGDLYAAYADSGIDPSIANVVGGLCEFFGLNKAEVHEKLFALMQEGLLLVEDGLFCVSEGSDA